MRRTTLYPIVAAGAILIAAAANRALPRLDPPALALVPVERLPRQIERWRAVVDRPMDERTSQILPKSKFLARLYAGPDRQSVEALLQSSSDAGEYHAPTVCLPAQGWDIEKTQSVAIEKPGAAAGSTLTGVEVWLQHYQDKMVTLYWYTSDPLKSKWRKFGPATGNRGAGCLFVRVSAITNEDFEDASRAVHAFAAAATPDVARLEQLATK